MYKIKTYNINMYNTKLYIMKMYNKQKYSFKLYNINMYKTEPIRHLFKFSTRFAFRNIVRRTLIVSKIRE